MPTAQRLEVDTGKQQTRDSSKRAVGGAPVACRRLMPTAQRLRRGQFKKKTTERSKAVKRSSAVKNGSKKLAVGGRTRGAQVAHADGPAVVLHHKDAGQLVEGGHVQALVELAHVAGACASQPGAEERVTCVGLFRASRARPSNGAEDDVICTQRASWRPAGLLPCSAGASAARYARLQALQRDWKPHPAQLARRAHARRAAAARVAAGPALGEKRSERGKRKKKDNFSREKKEKEGGERRKRKMKEKCAEQ